MKLPTFFFHTLKIKPGIAAICDHLFFVLMTEHLLTGVIIMGCELCENENCIHTFPHYYSFSLHTHTLTHIIYVSMHTYMQLHSATSMNYFSFLHESCPATGSVPERGKGRPGSPGAGDGLMMNSHFYPLPLLYTFMSECPEPSRI